MSHSILRLSPSRGVVATFGLTLALVSAASALTGDAVRISQKGQEFRPGDITIAKDGEIEIVNDDGDILHHAYVDSDTFKFDTGDQKPGSHTKIAFAVSGTFNVFCAIHPRMKLVVHVN